MIGRIEETKMLQSLLHEEDPQFIAVFGRRRIGKTYLVRESFHYQFTFQHTGISNLSILNESRKQAQLDKFEESLADAGYIVKADFNRDQKRKISDFRKITGTKYAIHSTLITTYEIDQNPYTGELQAIITAENLFQ